ncbi:MAG: hypothetical protein IKH16_04590 [Selenomonadaceae bacterium]|nr:hypothetical protein [Selenomonadaceae bacterium]MBR4695729.1 hypothetical protein [Selenomonadaceae bacterium]
MSITIDFTPAETQLLQAQATAANISVEEFSRKAIMKAANNAAYLAMLDKSFQQAEEGKGTYLTDEELRKLVYGNEL